MKNRTSFLIGSIFVFMAVGSPPASAQDNKIRVIFDTDANNEVDDQFALAYLLFNGDVFDVEGITVNATFNGGNIDRHYDEAKRIMQFSDRYGDIPLMKGADGSYEAINQNLRQTDHDGAAAVDFIIECAKDKKGLVLVAVGKLTNVALALKKEPSIASNIRVVWLGSNYPKPGEYNQDNDTVAMNYVLNTKVPFEMVTVRYGSPTGTDAVRITPEEVKENVAGKGPNIDVPVTGRHGGEFTNFGDYGVNLFEHIDLHGNPPSRALFDMAAVAILKNPSWAERKEIPAPVLVDNKWEERPANTRKIVLWENFDRDAIINDLYKSLDNYELAAPINK